jgi:hypothetical protein
LVTLDERKAAGKSEGKKDSCESRHSKRECRKSDAQLSERNERFQEQFRSLLLEFFVFGSGEVSNVFPSISVGGILTSGPPDLCTVFIKIMKRMTMYKPHFRLRDRFSERM